MSGAAVTFFTHMVDGLLKQEALFDLGLPLKIVIFPQIVSGYN
jgi:hypothetical protein